MGAADQQEPQGVAAEVTALATQAQEQALSLLEQARTRAREQVDHGASTVGTRASEMANDLEGVAEYLRSQGREGPAGAVNQAAQRVKRAAAYLEEASGEDLLHDVEGLGRERPWAVVAGGMALGLLASRTLKASSAGRYHAGGGSATSRSTARAGSTQRKTAAAASSGTRATGTQNRSGTR